MDLEAPLRTIVSPVEAEALRVLAGANTEFSASQVHGLSESASPFGVRKALARLATAGLALTTSHGNTTFWRGNREHVLWPAIELAVNARLELIERIRAQFVERNELCAYFYGSFARRTSTSESDIDILIVYPDDAEHESVVDFAHDLSQMIEAWTGNAGQIFNATRTWLHDAIERSDPVVMSLRQDAVALVGPEFEQLLRVIRAEEVQRA